MLVAFSGGALIASLTFLSIYPVPSSLLLLLASMVLFIISFFTVVMSNWTSEKSFSLQITEIDNSIIENRNFNRKKMGGGRWRTWTSIFNWVAFGSCMLGIILFVICCIYTIGNKIEEDVNNKSHEN
jgi:uncharacterized protein YqgC (DUF456 family)